MLVLSSLALLVIGIYGRSNLADFRWGVARVALRYGRLEEAKRFSFEAMVLYEQVATEMPHNLAYQQKLAARKAELGNFSNRAEPPKDKERK